MNFQTQAVAGAATPDHVATHRTHVVNLDTGKVLCKSVKVESLLDDMNATDPTAAPTCPTCARRDPRRNI